MSFTAFTGTGGTVVLAASTTSANIAIIQGIGQQIRVFNNTANVAFFRVGAGTQTAVATDTFVGPGASELFSIPASITNIAVILDTGTGNVYAQCGNGD